MTEPKEDATIIQFTFGLDNPEYAAVFADHALRSNPKALFGIETPGDHDYASMNRPSAAEINSSSVSSIGTGKRSCCPGGG